MTRKNSPSCPACLQGRLERRSKRLTDIYRGYSRTYLQPGEWCERCGEGILSGKDALATQERLLAWRTEVDKQEALELARIRRRLQMTQAEAVQISGGGKNAFSRYEKGGAIPVMAVSVLFKLLDRHPKLLQEAKELAGASQLSSRLSRNQSERVE